MEMYKIMKPDFDSWIMKPEFDSWDKLQDYTASQVAQFVRDNMFELNKHPMDYQDHYDYIIKLYEKWLEEQAEL